MSNVELLLREAERLSPECLIELLEFARFLNQKPALSSTASIDEIHAKQVRARLREWPDYWAESAKATKVVPRVYSAEEFIEKRSLSADQGLNG
jgi:hypothetical protein